MKKLSLRPYPGEVWLCESPAEFRAAHKRKTGVVCADAPEAGGGMTMCVNSPGSALMADQVYLVYADSTPILAHEFGHVLLDLFHTIGHEPTQGDGEPFCYLLGQLLEDALAVKTAKDKK